METFICVVESCRDLMPRLLPAGNIHSCFMLFPRGIRRGGPSGQTRLFTRACTNIGQSEPFGPCTSTYEDVSRGSSVRGGLPSRVSGGMSYLSVVISYRIRCSFEVVMPKQNPWTRSASKP